MSSIDNQIRSSINSRHLEVLTETKSRDINYIKNLLKNNNTKILKLTKLSSSKEATDLLVKIHAEINLWSNLVIVIFEIEPPLKDFLLQHEPNSDELEVGNLDSDELDSRKLNSYIKTPRILQFEYQDRIRIFIRDYRDKKFNEYSISSNTVIESNLLKDDKKFNLRFLLNIMLSNFGASNLLSILDVYINMNQCFDGQTVLDYALQHNSIFCLRFLHLFDWDLSHQNENGMRPLELAVTLDRLDCLKILLDISSHNKNIKLSSYQQALLNLIDFHDKSLMTLAVAHERIEIVKFLIDCNIVIEKRSPDLAGENKSFDILLQLLRADAPFPSNLSNISDEAINEVVSEREKFHKFIEAGNLDEVQKVLQSSPNLKFGYNRENQSALTTAIMTKNFTIYSFLRSKNFLNGCDEKFQSAMSELADYEHLKILTSNKQYCDLSANTHVMQLLSRTKLGFNVINDGEDFEKIKRFYDELYAIEELRPIIITVANKEDLQIIFDFNNASVHDLDPMQHKKVHGVTYYTTRDILIGAGCENHEDVLATIAHEFAHLAIDIIYDNHCKPFSKNDQKNETKFLKIRDDIAKNQSLINKEPVIAKVFKYNETDQLAELIVRVPHLTAFYRHSPVKFAEIEFAFKDLFNFYESITLIKLKIESEKIEKIRSIKLNDLSSLIPTFQRFTKNNCDQSIFNESRGFIISNSPVTTFLQVYQTCLDSKLQSLVVFTKLESLKNNCERINGQLKLAPMPTLIAVQTDLGDDGTIILNQIEKHRDADYKIVLIVSSKTSDILLSSFSDSWLTSRYCHKWCDLTADYQKHIKTFKIKFQCTDIALNELFTSDSLYLEQLPLDEILSVKLADINNLKTFNNQFYIKRSLVKHAQEQENLCEENEIFKIRSETFIIADIAGMGKSFYLTNAAKELAVKFSNYWISFLDLKQETENFSRNVKFDNFPECFVSTFLKSKTLFEQNLFCELYQENKVFLLLDGFDEIAPLFKDSVLAMMQGFKRSGTNQLWITTRLHQLEDLLKQEQNKSYHTLQPFSNEEQINFLVGYWKTKCNKSVEELQENAIKIQTSFDNSSMQKHLNSFIGVPLQARMLAEITENIVSRNSPAEIDFPTEMNFDQFYEKFVEKLLEVRFDKGPLVKADEKDIFKFPFRIWDVHCGAAVEFYFGYQTCQLLQLPLLSFIQKDMITRYSILQTNERGMFMFIHLTFADYFLVRFLIKVLFEFPCGHQQFSIIFDILIEILTTDKHEKTRIFLNDALIKVNFDTIPNNFVESFCSLLKQTANYSILHKAIKDNQHHILKLVLNLMKNREDSQLDVELSKALFLERTFDNSTTFHLLVQFVKDEEIINQVLSLFKFDESSLEKMLDLNGCAGRNILQESMLNGNKEVPLQTLKFFQDTSTCESITEYLTQTDDVGNTIFHYIVKYAKSSECFEILWESVAKLLSIQIQCQLISTNGEKHRNVFLMACAQGNTKIVYLVAIKIKIIFFGKHEAVQTVLTATDDCFSNALHLLLSAAKDDKSLEQFLQIFDEVFKKLLYQKNNKCFTPLNNALKNKNDQVLETFWLNIHNKILNKDLKPLLFENVKYGRNILYSLVKNPNVKVWENFFCIMDQLLDLFEIKSLLLNLDSKKENLLHLLGIFNANPEVIKFVLIRSKKGLSLNEFKSFLTAKCQDNNSPLHAIVSCNQNEQVALDFWKFIEQLYMRSDQNAFIKQMGYQGRNVLIRCIENKNKNLSLVIWQIMMKNFETDEILNVLETKVFRGDNIFTFAVKKSQIFCIELLEWSKLNMSKSRFLEIFTATLNGLSILLTVAISSDADFTQAFLAFIRRSFDNLDLRKLLIVKSNEKQNILTCCLLHNQKIVVEIFWNFLQSALLDNEFDLILNEKDDADKSFFDYVHSNNEYGNKYRKLVDKNVEFVIEKLNALEFVDSDKDSIIKKLNDFKKSTKSQTDLEAHIFEVDCDGQTVLFKTIKFNKRKHVFEALWIVIKESLSVDKQRKLLMLRTNKGFHLLVAAILNKSCNVMEPLLNILSLTLKGEEMKSMLLQRFENNQTILHLLALTSVEVVVIETLRNTLSTELEVIKALLEKIKQTITRDELKKFIFSPDSEDNTMLHLFAIHNHKLMEFYTIYVVPMLSTHEQLELISLQNQEGRNILACATQSKGCRFRYLWSYISPIFDAQDLIKLVLQTDKHGNTVIHLLVVHNDDYLKIMLQWLTEYYSDYESIFTDMNKTKNSLLFVVAEYGKINIMRLFFDFIRDQVNENLVTQIISSTDSQGNNVLRYATFNKNDNSFETFLECFISIKPSQLCSLLVQKNNYGVTAWTSIQTRNNSRIDFLKQFITDNFGEEETLKIISLSKKRSCRDATECCSKKCR